jgi:hypothetical protein
VKGEGLDYRSCEDCQQPTPPAEVSLPGQPREYSHRLPVHWHTNGTRPIRPTWQLRYSNGDKTTQIFPVLSMINISPIHHPLTSLEGLWSTSSSHGRVSQNNYMIMPLRLNFCLAWYKYFEFRCKLQEANIRRRCARNKLFIPLFINFHWLNNCQQKGFDHLLSI